MAIFSMTRRERWFPTEVKETISSSASVPKPKASAAIAASGA